MSPEIDFRLTQELRRREKALAEHLFTGANSADSLIPALGLPSELKGVKIADLGAGCSDLTPELLSQGADAYAVDRIYTSPKDIEEHMRRALGIMMRSYQGADRNTANRIANKSYDRFKNSYNRDRKSPNRRYIQASLSNLPFHEGSMDFSVSSFGIGDLAEDLPIFLRSVSEALRILKPGGEFVMFPFHGVQSQFSQYPKEHHALLGWLSELPEVSDVDVSMIPNWQAARLVAKKR